VKNYKNKLTPKEGKKTNYGSE